MSKRFAKKRVPGFLAWIRQQACCVTGKRTGAGHSVERRGSLECWATYVEAAHVKSRGAGGADLGNVVPLDYWLHWEQHRIGIKSFQKKYGVDLKYLAARYARRWAALQQGDPA